MRYALLGATAILLLLLGVVLATGAWLSEQHTAVSTVPPVTLLTKNPAPETPTASPTAPRLLRITIQDGERQQALQTTAPTVGAALREAGITLENGATVQPNASSRLTPNLTIIVQRPIPLTIEADGRQLNVSTHRWKPLAVLAEAGIGLIGQDYTQPPATASLHAGDTLQVIRVREEVFVEDEAIPFQTVYQASADLDLDTKAMLTAGVEGIKRTQTRIRYENDVEVSRTSDGEWIAQAPVNQVIGYGTRINLGVVETPSGPREYWRVVRMRVTAYTAASAGKDPSHPAYGITASGVPAGTGVVAIDPNVVPFRSEVFVPGYGVGFAGDTGGGVKGRWIDLGYDEDELQTWNGYVDVYYLTPIPDQINYLIPEVLP